MAMQAKALRAKEVLVTKRSRAKSTFPQGTFELKFERRLTEQELMEFSADNDHLRIEEDKTGKLIIMPPVDINGGIRERRAYGYLFAWWLAHKQGEVFSPSTGFNLPDTSIRLSGTGIEPGEFANLIFP